MKTKLLLLLTAVALFSFPKTTFSQAPNLGVAAGYVLFSTTGALSNTGWSHITGNVGSNSASNTTFGNVNGQMHSIDSSSAACATALLTAYNQLNTAVPIYFPAPLLGNGDTLIAGVYSVSAAATLNGDLFLDAKGNSSAVFIFQIQGPLSTNADSKVKLINGAMACNVFWKIEGLVSMASGTSMKGTVIGNNAAINMSAGVSLEGRALTTVGAITVNTVLAYTPIGCGSPVLTGPAAPALGSAGCYALFSTVGAVTNAGITNVTGDVGTNVGLTTGFDALLVTGAIHPIPDGSTSACATDLLTAYNYLNTLTYDIELMHPEEFGHNLVLTPHTYRMNGGLTFTDSLFLDAGGVADAIFVIQQKGAFSTGTYAKVILINGTQAKNVYWCVDGAVSINDYSEFKGTIICNNGAVSLNTGMMLDGRALTTSGIFSTASITANIPSACGATGIPVVSTRNTNEAVSIYPNPFGPTADVRVNDLSNIENCELWVYNALGASMMNTTITKQVTTLTTKNLPSGIYIYKVTGNGKTIQTGRLFSQQ